MLPDWLAQANPAPAGAPGAGGPGFVERTLDRTAGLLRETWLAEAAAARRGLFQALDPRVRLVSVLGLMVWASLLASPWTLWAAYLLVLLLAAASALPLRAFLARTWPLVLMSAVVALPALSNLVSPGRPVWILARLARAHAFGPYRLPATLAVTGPGLRVAATLTGRVAVSVSLAALLALTSRWSDLLRALAVLRVPALFILVLAMANRFLGLLLRAARDFHLARRSRLLRRDSAGAGQRWLASRIASLFGRTWFLAQEVHAAMLARGYSGEVRSLSEFRAGKADGLWCLLATMVCAAMLAADRTLLRP